MVWLFLFCLLLTHQLQAPSSCFSTYWYNSHFQNKCLVYIAHCQNTLWLRPVYWNDIVFTFVIMFVLWSNKINEHLSVSCPLLCCVQDYCVACFVFLFSLQSLLLHLPINVKCVADPNKTWTHNEKLEVVMLRFVIVIYIHPQHLSDYKVNLSAQIELLNYADDPWVRLKPHILIFPFPCPPCWRGD